MVIAEFGPLVDHLRLARPFTWEGRNEPEDSGAFLALWRGPSTRRVGYRSELRSNGRGPNPKCLPARPDVRHCAGQVRGSAARGQMPGGSGVRRSDEPMRDGEVGGQMPGGPGVRRSDEPMRDGAVGGQMPGGSGVRRSDKPLRDGAVGGQMPGWSGVRRSDEPLRDVVDTLIELRSARPHRGWARHHAGRRCAARRSLSIAPCD